MSTAELAFALSGHYEPTGAWSVEFRKRSDGTRITEVFFLLPPREYRTTEAQRGEIIATLGGGFYSDHGNEFKRVSLSGSLHFYYVGTSRTAQSRGQSADLIPEDFIDGFTEFLKLRFMLMRYRDYTLTRDGKLFAPDFSSRDLGAVNALKQYVQELVDAGDGTLANEIDVIFHCYDYDDHFLVKVEELAMDISAADPWTMNYSLSMIAYKVDDGGRVGASAPTAVKKAAPEWIRDVYLLMGDMSADTQPQTLPVAAPAGVFDVSNTQAQASISPTALKEI